jgi:uncharacterized protein with PQ loop repeat
VIPNSNPTANKIRYYAHFLMVALYLALGLLFLFTDIAVETFPANRTPIGIAFIIYGLFRMIMTIQKIRKLNS